MKDWRIKYKRDYLESLINRKRYERGVYNYIHPEDVDMLIFNKKRESNLSVLDATNALINEVREGKQL